MNARPFVLGIEESGLLKDYELQIDNPATCAEKLMEDQVDIGLVPVGILPDMQEYHLLTDYCIGCNGEVGSVCIVSDVPLDKIEAIYLDYQSRTSVLLTKILAIESWGITPEWLRGDAGYEEQIKGTKAGLVIGDRTFTLLNKHTYHYDLGEEWKKLTERPFVFACWVAKKEIPGDVLDGFIHAVEYGIRNKHKVIDELKKEMAIDVSTYLNERISYEFDEAKHKALDLFLQKTKNLPSSKLAV